MIFSNQQLDERSVKSILLLLLNKMFLGGDEVMKDTCTDCEDYRATVVGGERGG